jgi:hypothetical protein
VQIAIARFLSHSHGEKTHLHRVTRSGLAAERQKIAHELGVPSLTHDANGNPINEDQQATRAIDRFLKTRGVDAKDNAYTRGDLAEERKRIAQELGVKSLMHPAKVRPNATLQLSTCIYIYIYIYIYTHTHIHTHHTHTHTHTHTHVLMTLVPWGAAVKQSRQQHMHTHPH